MRPAERMERRPRGIVPTAPGGWPVVGHIPEIRRAPLEFLARAARQGDVVRLRLGRDVFLLNHPEHVQRVLHDNHANYRKSYFYQRLKPLVGDGLLTSEGAAWKRQRRLAQPAFHRERLASFAGVMAHHTRALLDRWERDAASGVPVNVAADMTRLALTVVGHALFGFDLLGRADEAGRALTTALRITNDRFYALLYLPSAPTPANLRFSRAMRVLGGVVRQLIAARRAGAPREDLLGMLMDARDAEDGAGLTDEELRDEVMTMLLAGHETTANALTWALALLSGAPDVDRALHREASAVLGDRDATVADVPRLDLAARVAQEAMRLHPPVWAFGREAVAADAFGPFRVPAGAAVTICPWLLHRDPRFWDDPERFDPDRFLPAPAAARPKYAYVPFAAGPRMCIGNGFAAMEMQIVLGMIASRYRLELAPGRPVEIDASVTLRPRRGVWVNVARRISH
jgi:cytochrome P450